MHVIDGRERNAGYESILKWLIPHGVTRYWALLEMDVIYNRHDEQTLPVADTQILAAVQSSLRCADLSNHFSLTERVRRRDSLIAQALFQSLCVCRDGDFCTIGAISILLRICQDVGASILFAEADYKLKSVRGRSCSPEMGWLGQRDEKRCDQGGRQSVVAA